MTGNTRRRPRQADIAKLAGVSQATVSLVLSGSGKEDSRIPEETRKRVIETARTLEYVANPVARSLAGGRTNLIGLYTFESIFPVDHRDFYYPFLVGIESAAGEYGYDITLFTSATGKQGVQRLYGDGRNRFQLVDGSIMLGKDMDKSVIAKMRDDGYPFVLIGRRDIPDGGVTYVATDYATATAELVKVLHDFGHRKFAYFYVADETEPASDRNLGLERAVSELSLAHAPLKFPVVSEHDLSIDVIEKALDAGCTAYISHQYEVAAKLTYLIRNVGKTVPGDVSIAALDDPQYGDSDIKIAGFDIPRYEMGHKAIQLLVEKIGGAENNTVQEITFPIEIVMGDSIAINAAGE